MVLSEADWNDADPRESIIRLAEQVLEENAPDAVSVDDIVDESDSGGGALDFIAPGIGMLEANLQDETARLHLSVAFDYLTYRGIAEKRVVDDEEGSTAYYRLAE